MKRKFLIIATITCIFFTACQNTTDNETNASEGIDSVDSIDQTTVTDIPYQLAENYFVKNTVKKPDNPKIETQEKFNEVFGMATTMGKSGKPTDIDFTKQYVIAVILPETDINTTVDPLSLQKNGKGEMTLTFKITARKKQTFTTVPNFAIIVDKAENGNLKLKEIK